MITPAIENAIARYFNQVIVDHLGFEDEDAINAAKTAFIDLLKSEGAAPAGAPCSYVFTKGKNKDQPCGVVGCKKHSAKASPAAAVEAAPVAVAESEGSCPYVFTKGKNKGQTCGAKSCKKHAQKSAPASPAAVEEEEKQPLVKQEKAVKAASPKVKPSGPSEAFNFETSEPVQWSEENMKWWKNWRTIQAETCGETGCRWHRTTKIVIRLDTETNEPHLVGLFEDGKFTPKAKISGAAYNWAKACGIKV
jgi:hypothetical protein